MRNGLLSLNLLMSLASTIFATVALSRPATLSGSSSIELGEVFYARMYAAHAIPLGLATGILPFFLGGPAVSWILFTAASIQFADLAIGIARRERGMMLGPPIAAVVHLLCGYALL